MWRIRHRIGGVLAQEGHLVAYFSEKLNDAKQKYSTYDKEFYAVIQALHYWRHNLLLQEFVLFSDHEALKYIYSQKKLNARHSRWIELLQDYTFSLRHKENWKKAVDALSRRMFNLTKMSTVINDFERLKTEYESCPDFHKRWNYTRSWWICFA